MADKQLIRQIAREVAQEIDRKQVKRIEAATVLGVASIAFIGALFYAITKVNEK